MLLELVAVGPLLWGTLLSFFFVYVVFSDIYIVFSDLS